jgi:hypothetical protein
MPWRSVLLFFLAASGVRAQGFPNDTTRHFRFSLLIGYGSIASYDNFGSPLPYSGITTPLGGEIEYVTPNVRHLFSVIGITSLGNAANLTNQYSDNAENYNNATYAFGDVRYRFTHYLTDLGSTGIHLSIGGEWENMAFIRGYNYEEDFNVGSGSGEFSSALAAAADLTYERDNIHFLTASLSLPLLAFVVRPAYGFFEGNNLELGERFEPIGTMWSWRIGFDYDYAISGPFLLGLHFHEFYYNYPMYLWRGVGAENDLTFVATWRFDL